MVSMQKPLKETILRAYNDMVTSRGGTTPAAIDFEHTEGTLKGKTWKGIYALEGDTLTICDNALDLDKARPATCEARIGAGYMLLISQGAKLPDATSDERELTQLIKDLNEAIVKAEIAFLERVLHEDYIHIPYPAARISSCWTRMRSKSASMEIPPS